jgi:allophanate hydrolase subunit 2
MTSHAFGRVLAGVAVLLVIAGGVTVPAYLSPANTAWLGAFGVACAGALLVMHENARPTRSIAQILYDTERSGRSARRGRDL